MAFALIAIGVLMFVAAYHNNVAALGSQIKSDIVGSTGFAVWVVAIFIIGAIGYVPALKGVSRAFLVLVLVVIFLSNKGVWSTLTETMGLTESEDQKATTPATTSTTTPTTDTGK